MESEHEHLKVKSTIAKMVDRCPGTITQWIEKGLVDFTIIDKIPFVDITGSKTIKKIESDKNERRW